MLNLIAIFLGAGFGALGRHGTQVLFERFFPGFPLGTLVVNIIGCFLIGLGFSTMSHWPPHIRLALITGFLGSLTTFSSFALDVAIFAHQKELLWALATIMLHVVLGLLACFAGMFLTRLSFLSP
ncbi:MAG: fluoride efflux transporter CrcB [Pseudobacteriovorax sp.]|nr:fluoride efflux transporter CrcB [Pseudobacteriovorax sp.]